MERIQRGDLDSPIAYAEEDEFKAACDAVDLMAAKLKAALEDDPSNPQLIQTVWGVGYRLNMV